jgi:hypothetical protein
MALARLILVLWALGLAVCTQAVVVPAEKPYYTRERERTIQFLEEASLPGTPIKKNHAFVMLVMKPTRFDFFALALPSDRVKEFAQACDQGLVAAGLEGCRIAYSVERNFAVLDTDLEIPHTWRKATIRLDIARFSSVLRQAGFDPKIVVKAPQAASAIGMLGKPKKGSRWQFWKLAEPTGIVEVEQAISGLDLLGLVLFAVLLPGIMWIGFTLGRRIAVENRPNKERQREEYRSVVMGFAFGSIVVHFVVFVWLHGSGATHRFSDLWFPRLSTMPFTLILLGSILIINKLGKRLELPEAALFGRSSEQLALEKKVQQQNVKRGMTIFAAVMIPAASAGLIGLNLYREPRVFILSLLLGAITSMAISHFLEARRLKPEPIQSNDEDARVEL